MSRASTHPASLCPHLPVPVGGENRIAGGSRSLAEALAQGVRIRPLGADLAPGRGNVGVMQPLPTGGPSPGGVLCATFLLRRSKPDMMPVPLLVPYSYAADIAAEAGGGGGGVG